MRSSRSVTAPALRSTFSSSLIQPIDSTPQVADVLAQAALVWAGHASSPSPTYSTSASRSRSAAMVAATSAYDV